MMPRRQRKIFAGSMGYVPSVLRKGIARTDATVRMMDELKECKNTRANVIVTTEARFGFKNISEGILTDVSDFYSVTLEKENGKTEAIHFVTNDNSYRIIEISAKTKNGDGLENRIIYREVSFETVRSEGQEQQQYASNFVFRKQRTGSLVRRD